MIMPQIIYKLSISNNFHIKNSWLQWFICEIKERKIIGIWVDIYFDQASSIDYKIFKITTLHWIKRCKIWLQTWQMRDHISRINLCANYNNWSRNSAVHCTLFELVGARNNNTFLIFRIHNNLFMCNIPETTITSENTLGYIRLTIFLGL